MAENDKKRYFWLKLKKDFFKRHDIRIVESMSNGKDYILFYLKLLCESTSHEGKLRFSDTIPYNNDMLATITNTNSDIVEKAIKIFNQLKMIEILDDGTLHMSEVEKMIGYETKWAEKKREYRERQVEDIERTKKDNVRQEIEIEKELDIEKEKDINNISMTPAEPPKHIFVKPTITEIKDYLIEKGFINVDAYKFYDYYEKNDWTISNKGERKKMTNWKIACLTWYRNQNQYDLLRQREWDIRQREVAHKERIEEAYIKDVDSRTKPKEKSYDEMTQLEKAKYNLKKMEKEWKDKNDNATDDGLIGLN